VQTASEIWADTPPLENPGLIGTEFILFT